ncbi:hypothetical protein RIF29_39468 [Crotalaria pallida]|uniref:RING-type E3 ubiquitin transferase n=1 Tax=Crotalaria pallida TaxID=3830 RepID=A0AAN9E4A0_CROPI
MSIEPIRRAIDQVIPSWEIAEKENNEYRVNRVNPIRDYVHAFDSFTRVNPTPQHSIGENLERIKIEVVSDDSSAMCSICLEVFSVGSEATHMPHCSHLYHHNCIVKWLNMCNTCPLCRSTIYIFF